MASSAGGRSVASSAGGRSNASSVGGKSLGASPRPQLATKPKALVAYKGPGATGIPSAVLEAARVRQNRLRFVLERSRDSLKRVISLGTYESSRISHPAAPVADG